MRAIRVRITDAGHDRQPARIQQLARVAHRRVQADLAVDLDQSLFRQPDRLAITRVTIVLERDDGIDAVVAAVELDDDQNTIVLSWLDRSGRACEEAGQLGARAIRVESRRPRAKRQNIVVPRLQWSLG